MWCKDFTVSWKELTKVEEHIEAETTVLTKYIKNGSAWSNMELVSYVLYNHNAVRSFDMHQIP